MRVYFIRHGETEANAAGIHQGPHSKLSEIGIDQARFVAHRLSKLGIGVMLVSDLTRTRQTAAIVNEKLGKKVVYTPLLREIKRPSQVHGKAYQDQGAEKLLEELRRHLDEPKWHYSDEENEHEVLARADKALEFISQRKEREVLVISHGNFLKVLVFRLLLGQRADPGLMVYLRGRLRTKNTGISMADYHDGVWMLHTYNDYAHLG